MNNCKMALKLFVLVTLLLVQLCLLCEAIIPSPCLLNGGTRNELIKEYFRQGYEYNMIVMFLFCVHGVSISVRQLKRILRKMNLKRRIRSTPSHIMGIRSMIHAELRDSGSLLGYRAMWKRLKIKYNVSVPRRIVMELLAQVSPEDSAIRKKNALCRRTYACKGPNYVWHVDGYDKLKHYGFAIHGCIDGYSRRIMWLNVASSNNNPAYIAKFYLDCVQQLKGTPRILRCDCGTENTNLAFIQPFLRRDASDVFSGSYSFRYGKSVSNQRIEAWWAHLRRSFTQWWLELFQGLKHAQLFDETKPHHIDCIRFSFMHLIQEELDRTAVEWNCHRIRVNRHNDLPSGTPDQLYFLPEYTGGCNYLCSLDVRDVPFVAGYSEEPNPPVSLEFIEAALILMDENNLTFPKTVANAIHFYVTLTTLLDIEMQ